MVHSPRIDRHALKELLARASHNDIVANMILGSEIFDPRYKFVQPRVRSDLMHRRMNGLRDIVFCLAVVDELRESRRHMLCLRICKSLSELDIISFHHLIQSKASYLGYCRGE